MALNEKLNLATRTTNEKNDDIILIEEDDENEYMIISDIKAKMTIAHKTVIECANEMEIGLYREMLNRGKVYTGETAQKLKSIRRLKKPYKFKSILHSDVDIQTLISYRVHIRNFITDYYLKRHEVPSTRAVEEHFKANRIDWQEYKFVRKNICQYQYFPSLKKYLIIENPELVAERIDYFKKISRYRDEGRYIIYVDEKRLDPSLIAQGFGHSPVKKFLILASSTREGLIGTVFYYYDKDYAMEQWFREKMIPYVSHPCVFVISGEPYPENMPSNITHNSSKETITEWLEKRNVPHNPDSHKADLYALLKKYKGNLNGLYSSKLDNLIKNYGHEVLHVPLGYPKLNYFFRLWSETRPEAISPSAAEYLNTIIDVSKGYSIDTWRDLEKDIMKEEKQMHWEDREVELIIDNILTMEKDKVITKFDFPKECSTNFIKFTEDKVNNIIID